MEWMDAQVPFSCSPSDSSCWPAESHFFGQQLGVPSRNSSKQIFCICSEARDESIEPPVLTTLRSWKSSVDLNSQQKEDYSYCEDKKASGYHVRSSTQSAAADSTPSLFQEDIDGFIENSVEKKCPASETEHHDTDFKRDYFQTSALCVSQNQDFSAAQSSDMTYPQLIQLGSPCDADRRKFSRRDGIAAHGVPHMFQTIAAPQCFPLSSRTPAESSLSVPPFQIFSAHPSKIFSEHAPSGSIEREIRAFNAYLAPQDDPTSTSSASNEAEAKLLQTDPVCFLKQPHLAVRQNQFNTMPVQNSDVQRFLFSQTKTRQHRSTSIRIIEYNDIEHCPYQQGVIQDNKASDNSPAQPAALPFVNESNYQQPTAADFRGSCIENTQTCKQSSSVSNDGNVFAISGTTARMGGATDSYLGYPHSHHSPEEFYGASSRPQTSRIRITNENAGNYAVEKAAPPGVFQENGFHSFHSNGGYGDRFGFDKAQSRLPASQNSSFFMSHGSVFCGQMQAAGTSTQQERSAGALTSTWRENMSRQGYSFDSYGGMELNPACRGNIGTNNMSGSEIPIRPKQVPFRTKSKDQKKRRFVCTYLNCTKKYFKPAHLEMHLRKHAGERPYSCTFKDCKQKFKRSDQLKRHGRCHTREKPYTCMECGKRFARSDHLKTHTKTHVVKPYPCCWEYCKKKFAHRDELCHHQISHNSPKKKSCFRKNQDISPPAESPGAFV